MIYRVHYTCDAGHTTYTDYKSYKSAKDNFKSEGGWIPTMIEIFKGFEWKKINDIWHNTKRY